MSADNVLYYWPIPFRGHFARYVLAYSGASWAEAPVPELASLKSQPVAAQPVPFMAPPLLHDRQADVWISQLPAILAYLGRKHGLMPEPPVEAAMTHKILGDSNDVLEEVTCNCGKAMWTRDGWEEFAAGRFARWLQIFEETGRRHGLTPATGHILGTVRPMLADLATAALWFTMSDRLPAIAPSIERHAPAVAGLSRRISELPGIAAMRRDFDRLHGNSYCGGEIEKSLRSVLSGA